MDSRRNFLGHVATGLAGTIATSGKILGANERLRLGIIGIGARGTEIVRDALACPNVEMVAFADVYTKRLEQAKAAFNPQAKTHLDYRHLLEDKDVDAVLIATPQHLHCEHFVASLDAGKHIYQEKTMAFTVEHAKRMRAAFQRDKGKHVVTVGHQHVSTGAMADAQAMIKQGLLGKVTEIHSHMYRNTPHGKPQWSRPVEETMNPEQVMWKSFLGEAPDRPFDANRYQNWRFFWDYSGGNFYENMCHQVSFWYKAMNLGIPKAVTTRGGIYLWKDGREVPDTMNVVMEQPEEMLFTWTSGFGNSEHGFEESVLGTDGTILHGQQIRYRPQKVNRREPDEFMGKTPTPPQAHMRNFVEAIRTGVAPNCPFDLGFKTSIACRMAVDSYRLGRTVKWDMEREEIV